MKNFHNTFFNLQYKNTKKTIIKAFLFGINNRCFNVMISNNTLKCYLKCHIETIEKTAATSLSSQIAIIVCHVRKYQYLNNNMSLSIIQLFGHQLLRLGN